MLFLLTSSQAVKVESPRYNMAAHDLSPSTQGVGAQSSFLAKPASGQCQKKIYDGESQPLTPSWGGVVRVATCST